MRSNTSIVARRGGTLAGGSSTAGKADSAARSNTEI